MDYKVPNGKTTTDNVYCNEYSLISFLWELSLVLEWSLKVDKVNFIPSYFLIYFAHV